MDTQLFESNLQIFSNINPHAAKEASQCSLEGYTFVSTRQNELNLSYKGALFFHANYSAEKEAKRWFEGLKLKGVNVLYVFGLGLGHYYTALKAWLKESPDRYVVFLENRPQVLKCFLHTALATEILGNSQVQLHLIRDLEQEGQAVITYLSWFFIMLNVEVSALACYEKEQADFYDRLTLKLLHQVAHDGGLAKEYLYCHELFFKNFYHNLAMMHTVHHGNQLFEKFQNVPAIICGAGPSLNKNLDKLKAWQDKALVFAGGSSINALGNQGIFPHFGGGIDPNKAQLDRSKKHSLFSLPMFYRNRWNKLSLQYSMGPRLYLNGCGGYSIADWFEKELGIEGKQVEEGHNIINFLMEVVLHLGCNPIILVGMDLSFNEGKSYADGIVKDAKVGEHCMNQLSIIQRTDIYGKPLKTQRKWVVESEWIASYAKLHPEVSFYNATEGGLGFEGIENIGLEALEKKLNPLSQDYYGWVNQQVQAARVSHIHSISVMESFTKLNKSLSCCLELIQEMKQLLEKAEKKAKKMKLSDDFMETSHLKNLEEQLISEPAYQHILQELNSVRMRLLQRKLEELSRDEAKATKTAKTLESIKINKERLYFLKQVAASNLQTMQQTIELLSQKGYDTEGYSAS